jgi:hypothetical protein
MHNLSFVAGIVSLLNEKEPEVKVMFCFFPLIPFAILLCLLVNYITIGYCCL